MELYPLLYFATVAETGSLTRAAERLSISAPALSNSIRRLESDLGVDLFDRAGRSLILNDCGREYLSYVQKMLTLNEQANERMCQMREEQDRHLSIVDTTFVFASHLISEFLKQHPQIRLHRTYVSPAHSGEIDLTRGHDLAIGSTNAIRQPGLEHTTIRSASTIMAIVNKANPLAARQSVTMAELSEQPMIAYAPGLPGRIMLDSLFSGLGRTPTIIYEGNVPHAMAPALERDLGVFLQAQHTARFNLSYYKDCVAVPITDADYRADTSLFWAAGKPLSPAAELFCRFCEEYSQSDL